MIFKDAKELSIFMKSCAKLGVKEIRVGDLSVSFYPVAMDSTASQQSGSAIPKEITVNRQASRAADEIEQSAQKDEELNEREEQLAKSLVDNPEDFEDAMVEELLNGN